MTQKTQMPDSFDLATLWMETYFKGQPCVVLFNPLNGPADAQKTWDLIQTLGVDPTYAVSAKLVVIPQKGSVEEAIEVCNSIPEDLSFAMTWDGYSFVEENT